MERLARDKRCSLLEKFLTYGSKMFYNIDPTSHCDKAHKLNDYCDHLKIVERYFAINYNLTVFYLSRVHYH